MRAPRQWKLWKRLLQLSRRHDAVALQLLSVLHGLVLLVTRPLTLLRHFVALWTQRRACRAAHL